LYLEIRHLRDFLFLFRVNPMVGLGVFVVLFSLAGIPPFAGFFSKLFVFWCLLKFCDFLVLILVVLVSVVSCVYYIRLVQLVFFFFFFGEDTWGFFNVSVCSCYFLALVFLYNLFFVFFFDLILFIFHNELLSLLFRLDFSFFF